LKVTESWAGLTLSRPLSESLGLGLTWYGVYGGQRTRSELNFQAIEPDGRSIAVSGVTDFDYAHYRTLAKLGLAWQTSAWNAGISVTTPSLGAFGSGAAAYTLSLAGRPTTARPGPWAWGRRGASERPGSTPAPSGTRRSTGSR